MPIKAPRPLALSLYFIKPRARLPFAPQLSSLLQVTPRVGQHARTTPPLQPVGGRSTSSGRPMSPRSHWLGDEEVNRTFVSPGAPLYCTCQTQAVLGRNRLMAQVDRFCSVVVCQQSPLPSPFSPASSGRGPGQPFLYWQSAPARGTSRRCERHRRLPFAPPAQRPRALTANKTTYTNAHTPHTHNFVLHQPLLHSLSPPPSPQQRHSG